VIKDFPKNHKLIKSITKDISNSKTFNGKILFLTISGSHLYGFTSRNSDVDYRGAYIAATDTLLGILESPPQYGQIIGLDDVELFEVKKFLGLALKMNCNIWEHIYSDRLMIVKTKEFLDIRTILHSMVSKGGLYHSYEGMARGNYDKWIKTGNEYTIKKFLYVVRALLAGLYFLENKKIEPDINILNSKYGDKTVDGLVDLKRRGLEKDQLDPHTKIAEKSHILINKLFVDIDEAYTKCDLPETPTNEDFLRVEAWLKKIRRNDIIKRCSNKVMQL
jgi:predicted nucleotidyltransferase